MPIIQGITLRDFLRREGMIVPASPSSRSNSRVGAAAGIAGVPLVGLAAAAEDAGPVSQGTGGVGAGRGAGEIGCDAGDAALAPGNTSSSNGVASRRPRNASIKWLTSGCTARSLR